MSKRALCLALMFSASTVVAGPFKDVPKKHWAYGAIHKLTKSGLLQGKGGDFQGERAFSRYEMAVVLARYMEKLQTAKGSVLKAVEKTVPLMKSLAKEFSRELDLLGVKHQDLLARVTSLETRTDMHARELEALRSLAEENHRLLLQLQGAPPSAHARRPAPRSAKAEPASYGGPGYQAAGYPNHPAVYRQVAPPVQFQVPGQAPQAPGFQGNPQSYSSGTPTFLAQAPGAPAMQGMEPDTARLESLRMRARALLDDRPVPPAPSPGIYSGGPSQLANAIEDVRTGRMDVASAQQLGTRIESQLAGAAGRRSHSSVIYPLTERLFGPAGLGPPAGD